VLICIPKAESGKKDLETKEVEVISCGMKRKKMEIKIL